MTTGSPPRVAHVLGYYKNFTGSQRSTHLFVQHMDRSRFEPWLVSPGEGECVERFREIGVPVRVVPAPPPFDQFHRAFLRLPWERKWIAGAAAFTRYTARLARLFRENRIHIVHAADLRAQLLMAPAAHLAGARVVVHVRGEHGGVPRAYVVAAAALAHRMILVAPNVLPTIPELLRDRCVEICDPVVMPAPREIPPRADILRGLPEPLSLGDEDILVVCVGTLAAQKGAHRLIDAVQIAEPLLRAGSPPRRIGVVFAGKMQDDGYRRFVVERARKAGVSGARFLGWIPDEAVDSLYRVADIACFPGVQQEELEIDGQTRMVRCMDALPRAVTEPMTYGPTVVATTVAGIEQAVTNEVNGLLVPPSDPAALAGALVRLAQDPTLRRRLSAAARSIFDTCSIEANVAQMSRVYDELLAGREPRGAPV